jgi:hypothetical protein
MDGAQRAWTTAGIDAAAYAALTDGLSPSEVWSLLLDLFARRARQRTAAGLLRQWERDGFTRPAAVDQRTLAALDTHLLAAAHDFEALELSPLAPLGACSVVAVANQNRIVSAARGTEVVADPTNVLALECARRLRRSPGTAVRLATCHRCVRAQAVPDRPGFAPHFRMFCLASAGRKQKEHAFVVDAIVDHVTTHLRGLDRLEQNGYLFSGRRVTVLASSARAPLGDRIAGAIGNAVVREALDHAYYDGLRFMISARTPQGDEVPLVDGGAFDWVAKLASDRKHAFVASGMGAQLAACLFRR